MPSQHQTDYDVIVIGGGPGGSATGCYLARAGLRALILEKERFPREHVGESFVPSTTRVFRELGFLHKMEENGFPHKYGAAWTTNRSRVTYDHDWDGLGDDCQVDIAFAEREQAGVHQNYTYHVDRGKFDLLLLEHAEELGAEARQETAVTDVEFGPEGVAVRCRTAGGTEEVLTARMVVDASGRHTLLGNRLKLKVTDPVFNQYALHTWFEDYDRGANNGRGDFIYVHFLPVSNSWVWQIPITETITSIGVVTQKQSFIAAKGSHDAFFWDCVASRPEVHDKLRRARQLRPLKAEGDYSYAMTQICGDRFVLVGDAARFVDPIFSTGVSIALNSARLACQDIVRAFETGDFSRAAFRAYEETLHRGCTNWYNFITVYYRLNVLFTYFISNPNYRLDVLRLLQGDVYDEEEPVALTKMREVLREVEQDPRHPWHAFLGSLSSEAFRPAFLDERPLATA